VAEYIIPNDNVAGGCISTSGQKVDNSEKKS
jgi:hypothetical protein